MTPEGDGKQRRRMLLVFFVIFHTMFPFIFSRPWEIDPVAYKQTMTRRLNIRVAGSILYHYIIDYFKPMEKIKGNQGFLPPNLQNKARKDNYKFDNRPQIQPRPTEPGKEPEVFDDVFSKQELKAIFTERPNQFEDLKTRAGEFIERLEDIVGRAHAVKDAERKEESQKEYRTTVKKIIKKLKRARIYNQDEEVRDYGGTYREKEGLPNSQSMVND